MLSPAKGLYIHVPFCLRKCSFCQFVITLDRSETAIETFFTALEAEAAYYYERAGKILFDSLYLGGGTPSALPADGMRRLFAIVEKYLSLKKGGEVSCEVNPGDVDEDKLRVYRELGVNRISLGAQSFDNQLLRDMNRPHDAADIVRTAALIKKHGFESFSLDLLLAVPGQSAAQFTDSLRQALELEPKQMTLYDLEICEDTEYGARRRKGNFPERDEDAHEEMFSRAEEVLSAAGFAQYEIASFALPGYECRHNVNYWLGGEYLGLGPGAYSFWEGARYQLAKSYAQYARKCAERDWQPEVKDLLSSREKEIERAMTGIRLQAGLCWNDFPVLAGKFSGITPLLERDERFVLGRDGVMLSRKGRFLAESAAADLVGWLGDA